MFELLFLLLPIAAAYGYYMGRNSYKDYRAQKQTERTSNYWRGIDFLLHNDKEQGMDKFIAYLNEVHPTFESSLALGNLFRQRGEVDKAISLHTTLATNPDFEPNESELARLELARDFISAGLLDRAESFLLDLMEVPRQRAQAMSILLKLYGQERDYAKAIEISKDNEDILSTHDKKRLVHFHCELAQHALLTSSYKEAQQHLNSALNLQPNSIRPRLHLAELLLKEQGKNYQDKVTSLALEIARLDHSTGILVVALLKKCYQVPNLSTTNLAVNSYKPSPRTLSNSQRGENVPSSYSQDKQNQEDYSHGEAFRSASLADSADNFTRASAAHDANATHDANAIHDASATHDASAISPNSSTIPASSIIPVGDTAGDTTGDITLDTAGGSAGGAAASTVVSQITGPALPGNESFESRALDKDRAAAIKANTFASAAKLRMMSEGAQEELAYDHSENTSSAYDFVSDGRYRRALEEVVKQTHSATAILELCLLEACSSRTNAAEMLLSYLHERPNIKLFSAYMGLRSRDGNPDYESETILQLKSIVDAQIAAHNHYACGKCGFESTMMFWQCPSCRGYDTMRPKHSLDSD